MEELGIKVSGCDRAGALYDCISLVDQGVVAMDKNFILDMDEISEGWFFPCVAYPISDCRIFYNMFDYFNEFGIQRPDEASRSGFKVLNY